MATCVHCGAEVDPAGARCPECATPLPAREDPDLPGPGNDPAGTGAAAARGRAPSQPTTVAWEDPAAGFPRSLLDTWRTSLFEPGRFFRSVPWEDSLARPVLYYLIVAVVGAAFTLWWNALGVAVGLPLEGAGAGLGLSAGADAVVQFFITPFAALLGLGFWSLVLHVFVLLLAPERRGIGATVRALCYSYGPAVFSIVPVVGALVGLVWTVVLQVVAVREAHRTTQARAAAIVLLPLGLMAAAFAFLVFVAVVLVGVSALEVLGR